MSSREILKDLLDHTPLVSMERTPEWELQGLRFLAKVNPKRYTLREVSEMEGMIGVYFIWDNQDQVQIGSTIYHSRVRNFYESVEKPYHEIR